MIKKLSAALFVLMFAFSLCSCGFKNDNKDNSKKPQVNVEITAKSTAIHNHFKDRIPEADFKNTPNEKYEDGYSYSLSVKCSAREYKNYLKKIKKAGFEVNPVEADTYYSARDGKGYFVEMTYVAEMLTVYIGMA